jgi:hypothetical protein
VVPRGTCGDEQEPRFWAAAEVIEEELADLARTKTEAGDGK